MSLLTNCGTCGEPYLSEALKCPKCGAENPQYQGPDSLREVLVRVAPLVTLALTSTLLGGAVTGRFWTAPTKRALGYASGGLIAIVIGLAVRRAQARRAPP